ncbi:MAG: redoxin domain-containing protein [Phycisphaerales bacterium]|jgi:peroxiredoxin|nr:redoxin domain-containing protein [Phycisphaerales bacterium]
MLKSINIISTISAICILVGISQPLRPQNPEGKSEKDKLVAVIGEEAPEFSLKDQFGKNHRLSNYKGKIVVLEWFNETCPFCKKAWQKGVIPSLLENLKEGETEVVYLAVNSTANRPEEDVIKGASEFLEELEIEVPMLMDYDGAIGKMYGAKTTPHMFVVNADGVLSYQGALTDDPRFKNVGKETNYVLGAVNQLKAGKEVSPDHVKQWGCSVKYAGDKPRGLPKKGNPRRF